MDFVSRYLAGYSESIHQQVRDLIDRGKLQSYLDSGYPLQHEINNDGDLRRYVLGIKN
jgi:hypothetical protein